VRNHEVKKIAVVPDNLNTNRPAALNEAFKR
jgi:hypothetical protein